MSAQLANMSLYIPRVFPNYDGEAIAKVFESLRLGKVNRIDFVPKTGRDGKGYNAVYVHFEQWYDNVAARNFQARVVDPEQEARIVYDDPWFWIVFENKSQKRPQSRFTPSARQFRSEYENDVITNFIEPQQNFSIQDAYSHIQHLENEINAIKAQIQSQQEQV